VRKFNLTTNYDDKIHVVLVFHARSLFHSRTANKKQITEIKEVGTYLLPT